MHRFTAEKLVGGPLNIVMPIRAADDQECAEHPDPPQPHDARITVELRPEASKDARAMYLAFPHDSDYDMMLLREELETDAEDFTMAM